MRATEISMVITATTRATVIGGSSTNATSTASSTITHSVSRGRKRSSSMPSSSHTKYVVIGISVYSNAETTKHNATPTSSAARVSAWLCGLPVRHAATVSPRARRSPRGIHGA